MANYYRIPNFRKKYPEASDEIIECLKSSYRKESYIAYDLKVEEYKVSEDGSTVTVVPAREDSFERRIEEGEQFEIEFESVEDQASKRILIAQMMSCVAQLPAEEQELIVALFFNGKTEREYGQETDIHYMTIHNRKVKILAKLKKLMNL